MRRRGYNPFEQWMEHYKDENPGVRIPTQNVVCPSCDGEGKYVNPAIDGNGITQSEMDELGDDFREDYMRGTYDIRCEECRGNNVVRALSEDAPEEMKRSLDNWISDEIAYRQECEMERRLGC